MEDYKFFNFFMNNKLVIAVLCFGSHICNQPPELELKEYAFAEHVCLIFDLPEIYSIFLATKESKRER